jgi:hypothetical protein
MQSAVYGMYQDGQIIFDEPGISVNNSRVLVVFLENDPKEQNLKAKAINAVKSIQQQSIKNGLDKITLEEINAEIEMSRKERKR